MSLLACWRKVNGEYVQFAPTEAEVDHYNFRLRLAETHRLWREDQQRKRAPRVMAEIDRLAVWRNCYGVKYQHWDSDAVQMSPSCFGWNRNHTI